MVIRSFRDDDLEAFFRNGKIPRSKGWDNILRIVRRKLDMLHYAKELNDLRCPPGNRLESLEGNLKGCYSIRINDQWRIVFIPKQLEKLGIWQGRRPEFEPGEAGAEAAQLEQVERCRRVSNSAADDAAKNQFFRLFGYKWENGPFDVRIMDYH